MTEADLCPPVDPDHESRPPPKAVTATELEELLGQHREWLESKGHTGERASFHRALLPDAHLRGADFCQAILQGAELQNANLYRADLNQANLQGTSLQRCRLREATLEGAQLMEANLQEADLQGANLREANLHLAQVQDAKMSGAEMRVSLLHSADFLDALGLTARQVFEAETDERTRWPTYLREEMST